MVEVGEDTMYPRQFYVAALALAVGSLQFAAAMGTEWQTFLAYVVAGVLGVVIFYQGEAAVTAGPIFVNAGIGILLGTGLSHLFGTGLAVYLLGMPWDLALWQMGLWLWDSWVGIGFIVISTFFVVGFGSSLQ